MNPFEAAKTSAKVAERKMYKIPSGAAAYVCKDGVRVTAPGGIIAEYDDKYVAEFEENVRAGNFSHAHLSDAERPLEGAIISQ